MIHASRRKTGQQMKLRHKRLAMIAGGLAALGAAAAFVLAAFQENLVFFFTPSQVAAKEVPKGWPCPRNPELTAGRPAPCTG